MVYFMESSIKIDDNWGYPHDLGKLHMVQKSMKHHLHHLLVQTISERYHVY